MIYARSAVHLLCISPAVWMIARIASGNAGANPVEYLTRGLGDWGLRLLLLTLLVRPLAQMAKWPTIMAYRRAIGLYVFFYACCHLTTYLWLDQSFDWEEIVGDIAKRPFILAGMISFLLLVPLAATSNRFAMLRLGQHWQRLHRLIYVIACVALLHYWWLVRADFSKAWLYLSVLVALFVYRLWAVWRLRAA